MINFIQLSLFGDFEKFSTANTHKYLELISFFSDKKYQPTSTNQLKMNSNGIVQNVIMPVFVNENVGVVEILGERINFKMSNISQSENIESSIEKYKKEIFDDLKIFLKKFDIVSNRLALLCETSETIDIEDKKEKCSNENDIEIELAERRVIRRKIRNELCNIIQENHKEFANKQERKLWDINTLFEQNMLRFECEESLEIFNAFFDVLKELKGDV